MEKLADHSETVQGRSESDVETRYYKAMAAVGTDYHRLLDRLAQIVADSMYDFCLVHLARAGGEGFETAAFHHSDTPGMNLLADRIDAGECLEQTGLLERVVREGQSFFRPEWSAADSEAAVEGTLLAEDADLQVHSLMIVPLRTTPGHTLGTMTVARHATSTPFDENDLALAESMAAHAAMKAETIKLNQDLRRANQKLEEAVDLRDTFISIASHELRTPLGAMQLLVELLRRRADAAPDGMVPADACTEKLTAIERQVGRMSSLVDRLLDVSRISEGRYGLEFEEVDFGEVVREAAGRIREGENGAVGDRLNLRVPDSVLGEWDRARIDQIVTNLVSNAVKYAGESPIDVSLAERDEWVELKVADSGDGIPAAEQERIFKRFEQCHNESRRDGLGLGLWIVREMVEAMDGSIDVESEEGRGATFSVRLPKKPSRAG
jgi:signal transduction histidine kinase